MGIIGLIPQETPPGSPSGSLSGPRTPTPASPEPHSPADSPLPGPATPPVVPPQAVSPAAEPASPSDTPASATETFRYMLHGLTTSKSAQAWNRGSTIISTGISEAEAEKIAKKEGASVFTQWAQEYKFSYRDKDVQSPTAILEHSKIIQDYKDTAGNQLSRQELLARTVMTMIDNVITKSKELHISSPDPFVIAVAKKYVAFLNQQAGNCTPRFSIAGTFDTSRTKGPEPQVDTLFNGIIQADPYKAMKWFTDDHMLFEAKKLWSTGPAPSFR